MHGWKTIGVTRELLNLVSTVQDFVKYRQSHNSLLRDFDPSVRNAWFYEAEKFYYSLPQNILDHFGLSKNRDNFDFLRDFRITPEMGQTPTDELPSKYQVTFWCVNVTAPVGVPTFVPQK